MGNVTPETEPLTSPVCAVIGVEIIVVWPSVTENEVVAAGSNPVADTVTFQSPAGRLARSNWPDALVDTVVLTLDRPFNVPVGESDTETKELISGVEGVTD